MSPRAFFISFGSSNSFKVWAAPCLQTVQVARSWRNTALGWRLHWARTLPVVVWPHREHITCGK